MTNPSTIWAQLSIPNPPAGSCPYVTVDGITISTDVMHYSYIDNQWGTLTGSQLWYQLTVFNGVRVSYADTTSTPATNITINKSAGRFKIPLGSSAVTVNCSNCFATSIVHVQLESADTTLTRLVSIPAAGSFIVSGNANSTAAVTVSFTITNVF